MPYYSFDLVNGVECRNQGGLILEGLDVASDRAKQLANELCRVMPELKTKGYAVRVTGGDNKELSNAARSNSGVDATSSLAVGFAARQQVFEYSRMLAHSALRISRGFVPMPPETRLVQPEKLQF
jgi:hypothetical protein